MTTSATPGKRKKAALGMGMSEALADSIFAWANVFFISSLIVGVVSAFLIYISVNVKEEALKRDLSEANERIAEARRHTAELNNETTRLRANQALVADQLLANAEAGKLNAIASRRLLTSIEVVTRAYGPVIPGQIRAAEYMQIVVKAEPFSGKQFDATVTSSELELEELRRSISSAPVGSGWVEVPYSKQPGIDHAVVRGVVIRVDASKDSGLLDAAQTLASALNGEGIAATVNPKAESDTTSAKVIHILVGPKP